MFHINSYLMARLRPEIPYQFIFMDFSYSRLPPLG